MPYDGQSVVDLDVTRPDGDAEPKSILDDVTKEIKRAVKNTPYSWSRYENLTGATLSPGNVVALGGVGGLIINDVQGSFFKHVVVVESIAASAVGLVAREGGPVAALSAGAVTAFNYIRKSVSPKAFEDMGISISATTPIPNGAIGFALESVGAAGLCDIFLFERSSTAPTELADHILNLVNRTGVVIGPGESVSPSDLNDNSTVLNDVQGTLKPILIAHKSIPNITSGEWIQSGVHTVVIQGIVQRLAYLRKSATSRALESTGVLTNEISGPPPGTVGVALSSFGGGGTGTVSALLFGSTVPLSTMAIPGIVGLRGVANPNFPLTRRDYITPMVCMVNPVNRSTVSIVDNTTLTCDVTVQGRGGRDQASVFSPNVWLYFYLTWDGLTRAIRASINPPTIGPVLANGETHFTFLDVIRFGPSSNLVDMFTVGDWSYYRNPVLLTTNQTVGGPSVINISMASSLPPIALEFEIDSYGQAEITGSNQGGYIDFEIWILGPSAYRIARLGITGVSDGNVKRDGLQLSARLPNIGGILSSYWRPITGSDYVVSANVMLLGYRNPN